MQCKVKRVICSTVVNLRPPIMRDIPHMQCDLRCDNFLIIVTNSLFPQHLLESLIPDASDNSFVDLGAALVPSGGEIIDPQLFLTPPVQGAE